MARRRLSLREQLPFHRPFSYDEFHEILSYCSHSDLLELSLVSKALNADVQSLLWQAAWLPFTTDSGLLEEACEAITRTSERCSTITKLTYRSSHEVSAIYTPKGYQGLGDKEQLRVAEVLHKLPNLVRLCLGPGRWQGSPEWLKIFAPHIALETFVNVIIRECQHNESSKSPPFRLRRLDVSYLLPDISTFLASQPTIEHLVIWNRDSRDPMGMTVISLVEQSPSISMPNLRYVSGTPYAVEALAACSPALEAVALHLRWDNNFPQQPRESNATAYPPLRTALGILMASTTVNHIGFRLVTFRIAPTLHHLHKLGHIDQLKSIDININTLQLWVEAQASGDRLENAELATDDESYERELAKCSEDGIYTVEKRQRNDKTRWHLIGQRRI